MPKLTDAQVIILAAAAKRDDGSLLPMPKKLKLDEDAADALVKNLLKRKLIEEQTAIGQAATWRSSEDGHRLMLVITAAGLRAIGIEPTDGANSTAKPVKKARQASQKKKPAPGKSRRARYAEGDAQDSKTATRSGTKQARVIELLRRPQGASIAELVKATGWQQHSVRGVIAGTLKKKLGLTVISEKAEDSERRYHIGA
jgi:Protein of unknown function (DUF3489)